MWQNLEQSLTRYRELEQQMADPVVIADRNRYTQAAKEHGALAKLVRTHFYPVARLQRTRLEQNGAPTGEDPSNAGPVTGCRTRTTGAPGSTNPARWGRAKTAVVSVAANASHCSRIRCAPARSSEMGRLPAKGAHAGEGSGSSK